MSQLLFTQPVVAVTILGISIVLGALFLLVREVRRHADTLQQQTHRSYVWAHRAAVLMQLAGKNQLMLELLPGRPGTVHLTRGPANLDAALYWIEARWRVLDYTPDDGAQWIDTGMLCRKIADATGQPWPEAWGAPLPTGDLWRAANPRQPAGWRFSNLFGVHR